jgi:PAS domain S-box-containing protein
LGKKCEQLSKTLSARTGELMLAAQELRRQQSARERAEKAYRDTSQLLEKIFSTSQISLAFLDTELKFIRVNEGYAAAAGYPPEFFPGRNYFELFPSAEFEAMFRESVRTGRTYSAAETPLIDPLFPERETTYWDWNLIPVKGAAEEVEALLFCSVNVTERVRDEKASRDSEAVFRRLFDEAPIGAGIVGLDYRFQHVNNEYCRITGYSAEEMTALTFAEITHPDDLNADLEFTTALTAGEIDQYRMEKRYIRKDGAVTWVRLSVRLLRNPDGKPLYFLPLVEDIVEHKKAEEALLQSEERYRLHFENVSDVVYVTGRDFRVSDISPSVKGLLGYDPEEIIGRRIDELSLLPPEYVNTALTNTLRIFSGEKSGPTEYEFITKDGVRKFGEISGSPLWKGGEVIASIAVARDITQRKQIEVELERYRLHLEEMVGQRTEELINLNRQLEQEICERKKAEAKLRNQVEFSERLIDSSADGIVAFDCDARFTVWNPAMEQATGVQKEYALGKKALDVFPYLRETGEDQNYFAVLAGKTAISKDRPYCIRETGREGFYEAHYSPLRNESGEIIGGLAVIRDITGRKQMEEAVRESEESYRRLSESLETMVKKQVAELKQAESLAAIGKMVSVVAHEVRNPLQSALLGFETLRIMSHDKEFLETLKDIESSLDMLNGVVDELLDFSRPTRLNRRPCRIGTTINNAIDLLRPRLHNIQLHFDLEDAEKEILVDREKLSRALLNLLANAIEAMPGGGELRLCSNLRKEEVGWFLKINIADSGCGIPEDILLQIEEPFFTTKPRGTGLGLSICRKIIDAHGGHMYITSKSGIGTSIDLILPAIFCPE